MDSRQFRSSLHLTLSLLCFGLLWAGCSSNIRYSIQTSGGFSSTNSVRQEIKQQPSAAGIRKLKVDGDAGTIRVDASDTARAISIVAEKVVSGPQPEADLQPYLSKVETTAKAEGDTLHIHASYPRDQFTQGMDAHVDYVLTVPRKLSADLVSANGAITITGLQVDIVANASNGAIDIGKTSGGIDLHTSNGAITLDHVKAAGHLHAATSNGSLVCQDAIALTPSLDVQATTENGRIEYSGDGSQVRLETSNGAIQWNPTTRLPLATATARTSNSSVVVSLPDGFSAHIDAKTSNGSIHTSGIPNAQTGEDQSEASYTLGSGAGKIELETSNGGITIERNSSR